MALGLGTRTIIIRKAEFRFGVLLFCFFYGGQYIARKKMGRQYNNFLTQNNLKLSFKRLQTVKRDLYKDLYRDDMKTFGEFLDLNIHTLRNQLREKIYVPGLAYKIYIPKKNNLVRPITVLNFIDLLVYQSIVNVIADTIHGKLSTKRNYAIFGTDFNLSNEKDSHFFLKKWKSQWKEFGEKSKLIYNSGFTYISEFDIASFYDTIDHEILGKILIEEFAIEKSIIKLLLEMLRVWTRDQSRSNYMSRHGIPQGPVASTILADVYLHYIDEYILKYSSLDIKYIRYVDDIRIFSKDETTGLRSVALLDLLARDLGLIPQSNKVVTKNIENFNEELANQKLKFSEIQKEIHKNGHLRKKTNEKLKKKLVDAVTNESSIYYLDKTIISFSLFKLNKDDEVKLLLLTNFTKLWSHFEGLLYYLRVHFNEDEDTIHFLSGLLMDEKILFSHIKALILKNFPNLPFNELLFIELTQKQRIETRYWLTYYYLIDWLHFHKRPNLLTELEKYTKNFHDSLSRKAKRILVDSVKDNFQKKLIILDMLKSNDSLTALQGLSEIMSNYFIFMPFSKEINSYDGLNIYVKAITNGDVIDFLNHSLYHDFGINNSINFFNSELWPDQEVFAKGKQLYLLFVKSRHTDRQKALIALNNFNELTYYNICTLLDIEVKQRDYGGALNAKLLISKFSMVDDIFSKVNDARNQKTYAHALDKKGKVSRPISYIDFEKLLDEQTDAWKEICKHFSPSVPEV